MTERFTSSTPWWVSLIVILGALLMAVGAVIGLMNPAMLVAPGSDITPAVRTYAGYFISRNGALAIALLVTLGLGSRRILSALMILTAMVQMFDAVLDVTEARWSLVPGVVVFAIAFILGAFRTSGRLFWRE